MAHARKIYVSEYQNPFHYCIFSKYDHSSSKNIIMSTHQHHQKMHHYNTPGSAHELTFSTNHRQPYLDDPVACKVLLEDIEKSRSIYNYRLWAYVLMPLHVHMLIWPLDNLYAIGKIESGIKGVMSKRYRKYLLENQYYNPRDILISLF